MTPVAQLAKELLGSFCKALPGRLPSLAQWWIQAGRIVYQYGPESRCRPGGENLALGNSKDAMKPYGRPFHALLAQIQTVPCPGEGRVKGVLCAPPEGREHLKHERGKW